jgi:hypothetical protein
MSTKSRIRRSLRRTSPRRFAAALAAASMIAPTAPQLASAEPIAPTTASVATPSAPLPFDLPSSAVLQSSPRKAFAHYVPWLPVSINNKVPDYYDSHFLVPGGENGKHAAYGGYMRDRPLKRAVIADTAWKLRDLEAEVRQAIAGGLDGFAVDIVQLGDVGGTQWTAINSLLQAASNVDPDFKIMLMPDMTGTNMLAKDAPTMAKYLAHLGGSPAAYRLADGRLVVSPFTAERKTVSYWTEVLSIMKSTYQTPVAFLPLFQDERKWRDAFDPISYGMSNWGNRNPAGNNPTTTHADSPKGRIAAVHALGQKWMQSVSVQDQRPRAGIFDEAQNTQNLRNTWEIARENGAELVQLPTWNDYPEGTQIAPSAENGWSYLDMSAYYLSWYKTGSAPKIVRDAVYLTHRTQPHAALPTHPQTLLMKLRGGSSPARDTVETLTFLTAPATVRVQVGTSTYSCEVSAGVDTCTVPLGAGQVSATVERNGTPVTAVASPAVVTTTPYVQDLQYVASASGRQVQTLVDTTPPSSPSGLAVSVSPGSVGLTWAPATDDRGVTGYEVHRSASQDFAVSSATQIGTASAASFTDDAAAPGTWHYRVVARDAAGHRSTASSPASATVLDTQAPSGVGSVTASAAGSSVTLSWGAATDDVGVTGYEVHRSATSGLVPTSSTSIASTATTSYSETAPGGTWYYRVVARDAAGNRGPASAETRTAVAAAPTVVQVRASADTYANQGAPSTNFGSSWSLSSRGSIGAVSYLRYAVPAAPAGKTLRSAALQIRVKPESYAGSGASHAVKVASNSWTESGVTWKQRPAVSSQVLGTIAAGTLPDKVYSTPLSTAALQSFAGSTRTFAVTSSGTDNLYFWSANHPTASHEPQLVLTYS